MSISGMPPSTNVLLDIITSYFARTIFRHEEFDFQSSLCQYLLNHLNKNSFTTSTHIAFITVPCCISQQKLHYLRHNCTQLVSVSLTEQYSLYLHYITYKLPFHFFYTLSINKEWYGQLIITSRQTVFTVSVAYSQSTDTCKLTKFTWTACSCVDHRRQICALCHGHWRHRLVTNHC